MTAPAMDGTTGRSALVLPSLIYLCVGAAHVYWGAVSAQVSGLESAATVGMLVSAQFGGFLVGVLAAPTIGRRIGVQLQVAVALALFAVAFSTPAWIAFLPGLLVAGVGFGIAAGTLETQVGALALQSPNGARTLTVLEVFFGLGAVAFPLYLLVGQLLISWRILVGAAAFGVLCLFLAWVLREPSGFLSAATPTAEAPAAEPRRRLPSRVALVMLVFIVFYAGFETNFANFLPAIVDANNMEVQSILAVSAFWTGITLGRLAATRVANSFTKLRTLALLAILLSVVLLVCAVLIDDGGVLLLGAILLAGLLAAGIFPGALAFCSRIGGVPTSVMTSYFVACASLGGALMAVPVGWSLENGGGRAALILFASFAGALVVLAGVAHLISPGRVNRP